MTEGVLKRPTDLVAANNATPLINSSHGYVALYRYVVEIDTVFILAVRSQQEAGYAGL